MFKSLQKFLVCVILLGVISSNMAMANRELPRNSNLKRLFYALAVAVPSQIIYGFSTYSKSTEPARAFPSETSSAFKDIQTPKLENFSSQGFTLDHQSAGKIKIQSISQRIQETIVNYDSADFRENVRDHLKRLRILDKSGQWTFNDHEYLKNSLYPDHIDMKKVEDLIENMAKIAQGHPYLVDTVYELSMNEEISDHFENKIAGEMNEFLPDVIAYAFVSQHLTEAMRNDMSLLEALRNRWVEERAKIDVNANMGWFDHAKLWSIEYMVDSFIKYHKEGNLPKTAMKYIIPVNILEAGAFDFFAGDKENANTAWTLATHPPHYKGKPMYETTWSEDGNAVKMKMPNSLLWAQLYLNWNMKFCTNFGVFPYVWVKLLIPQVNDFENSPDEYLYNRALALYLHLHIAYIGQADGVEEGKTDFPFDWENKELSKVWGQLNSKYAQHYLDSVDDLN